MAPRISQYSLTRSNRPHPLMVYLGVMLVGRTIGAFVTYIRIQYGGASSSIGQLAINTDFPGTIPTNFKTGEFSFGLHFFGDFLEPFLKSYFRVPYSTAPSKGFGVSNYPPLGQALFYPFRLFPYHVGLLLYLSLILIMIAVPTWCLLVRLKFSQRLVLLIFGVLLSYPLISSLDRGNFTGVALGLLLFAALSHSQGNYRNFGIFVALAACLKLTPVFFLIVLAKKRKWSDLGIAIGTGVTVSALSMLLFTGSYAENWLAFYRILGRFHGNPNADGAWRSSNNSLMALFQNMGGSHITIFHVAGEFLQHNFIFIVASMMTILLVSIFFSSTSDHVLLFAMTGLTVMTNLSIPVSFNYGLMFYLFPLLLLIISDHREQIDYLLVILIGLLLIDKTPFSPVHAVATGASLLNPLLQLLIFFICLRSICLDGFKPNEPLIRSPRSQIWKPLLSLSLLLLASISLTYLSMPLPKLDWLLGFVLLLPVFALLQFRNVTLNDKSSLATIRSETVKTDYLLGLRGAAALLVLIMHSGIVFKRDFTATGSIFTFALFSPAWLGMVLFFGLSGFLMAKSFFSGRYGFKLETIFDFLIKRVFRIYPVMVFTFLIICIKEGLPSSQLITLPLKIMTFSYIPTFGPEGLHAFWSLTTEMYFYLAVPFILMIISIVRVGMKKFLFVITVLLVFLTRLYFWKVKGGLGGWHFVYFPLYGNFDYFAAGIAAAAITSRNDSKILSSLLKASKFLWPVCSLAFLSYSAISYYAMSGVRVNFLSFYQFIFMVCLPSVMLGPLIFILVILDRMSVNDRHNRSILKTSLLKLLLFIGKISFPLYLIHSEVFIIIQEHLASLNYLIKFAAGSAIACVLSYLIVISIESYGVQLGTRIVAIRNSSRDV